MPLKFEIKPLTIQAWDDKVGTDDEHTMYGCGCNYCAHCPNVTET